MLQPRQCPHCRNPAAKLLPPLGGGNEDYDCPRCGQYRISGTTRQRIDDGADPAKGRFVMYPTGNRFLQLS